MVPSPEPRKVLRRNNLPTEPTHLRTRRTAVPLQSPISGLSFWRKRIPKKINLRPHHSSSNKETILPERKRVWGGYEAPKANLQFQQGKYKVHRKSIVRPARWLSGLKRISSKLNVLSTILTSCPLTQKCTHNFKKKAHLQQWLNSYRYWLLLQKTPAPIRWLTTVHNYSSR